MFNKDDEKFLRHLHQQLSQHRNETGLTVKILEKRARDDREKSNNNKDKKSK